ncbi:excinuclease ABC subunit C [Halobacterium salinarum]|uniref:UvrABC system protein C n=7 Tax=Halobacterium salinarum TaxID=2242 RepID=UVRC_HALSA|nr:excinuclease ABC subunit C [Halobacterium salinarum]B0R7R3.1 RecName: Full=UvrABC system protein C; Short=Protein UvrC; AltName: Full=Excinuclease ABC subunit C [Halobacterium salinarum R1]Q9HMU5.1 RecName: Full=UvrABC system protein C; Short=Protein UvrC; AltName: Full=Excinuclease ABC subunit C [Halobacterium salinarum NRC-1]AAG20476.1 excision nuclease chain C [Halobacterium salinarum NRC-1]MBB6089593.1 excinuclease ABC subunit C [Halobacterium salinarum]MDL0118477.1 excinuclease ABC sub
MNGDEVRARASELPAEPGVYQFVARDPDGTADGERVLYVGKAVDIRDRVRSYGDPRSERIAGMVARADDVTVAVTDTETQALLLEANLVKRHQPRYNVRLKDDKSYPLVQVTSHREAPRIEVTRDPDPGAAAFGPYTDKGDVETVVKAVRSVYGLRGCSEHKYRDRERPCLDYEMGLCAAPCTGAISEREYREAVESATRFFEGETGALADPLRREMAAAAQAEAFERAANLRDRLAVVEGFHEGGGAAVAAGDADAGASTDVLGVAVEGDAATVARLHAEGGQLVERDQHRLEAPQGEDRVAAVLAAFLVQYYAERDLPERILLPEPHGDDEVAAWLDAADVAVGVPGAGREARLVELALKNAHRRAGGGDELGALADALGVRRPERIEGVDVSHAQGREVVGSNVCFVDGSAETADYRRKKLDEENDDYANMRRLVGWRAERAVDGRDDRPDPDVLLVDGGRGQLDAALDAVEAAGWDGPDAVIALAKDEEVVVTPDRTYDWGSDAPQLHVLQRVRDEAHRFAVAYHRTLRDDVTTALDGITGVGPELRARLLGRFGSVAGVRQASVKDLRDVAGVGEATAETIAKRL